MPKDGEDSLMTFTCYFELFQRKTDSDSVELAIYDASNLTCSTVYFLVTSMKSFFEHLDLFSSPPNELLLLLPQEFNKNEKKRRNKINFALGIIRNVIKSKGNSEEVKRRTYALLRIGMVPGSITALENLIQEPKIDEDNK